MQAVLRSAIITAVASTENSFIKVSELFLPNFVELVIASSVFVTIKFFIFMFNLMFSSVDKFFFNCEERSCVILFLHQLKNCPGFLPLFTVCAGIRVRVLSDGY